MFQSLGISVGNLNSYVAAGRGGGIEILLNEYSNRYTPSMVAFTSNSRSIGTEASQNFFMNIKNTVYDLMVLLGKTKQQIEKEGHLVINNDNQSPRYMFRMEDGPDGQALVVVRHLDQERKFTVTQVLAMLFTKLREVAGGASDCVLSCPQFFNDKQKEALVQAASIAGLSPLQIISDMSAVVLNYAYYRTTREDSHRFAAFVNFGQSNLQTVLAYFNPKEDTVRILAAESETIGGKDFDEVLAKHFVKQSNLNLNQKSYLKLVASCEKLKKLLSSNANDIPIHVESLISDEQDFTSKIDRSQFESLSQHLLLKVKECFKRTFRNAEENFHKIKAELVTKPAAPKKSAASKASNNKSSNSKAEEPTKSDAQATETSAPEAQESEPQNETPTKEPPAQQPSANDSADAKTSASESSSSQASAGDAPPEINFDLQVVELVGGSTRIPAVKQLIQEVFNIAPSTTLNTDEAVARGCVLHCATLHPGLKVKRQVKIIGAESFIKPTSGSSCNKELRRIELELITSDNNYKNKTEARNNLEEYIYSERSKIHDEEFLNLLGSHLDWLFSDDGENAPEGEYNARLSELKKMSETRLKQNNNKCSEATNECKMDTDNSAEANKTNSTSEVNMDGN